MKAPEPSPLLLVFALALVLVLATTVTLHDRHYRDRRLRILEGRVRTLESILSEDELS